MTHHEKECSRAVMDAEEAFVKRFGPMTIETGSGHVIANYAVKQRDKLEVWKAAVEWAQDRLAAEANGAKEL